MNIRTNIETLQSLYDSRSTPLVTYTNLCETIRYSDAGDTIAAIVDHLSWDGRISPRNAEWARDRVSNRDIDTRDAYTTIHPAHVDQIADIARKLNY